jgi:hypothetical protein
MGTSSEPGSARVSRVGDSAIARQNEDYPWVWTQDDDYRKESSFGATPKPARVTHALPTCVNHEG